METVKTPAEAVAEAQKAFAEARQAELSQATQEIADILNRARGQITCVHVHTANGSSTRYEVVSQ